MFQHPFKKDSPTLLPMASASSNTTAPKPPLDTPTDVPVDPLHQQPQPGTSTSNFTRRTKPPPLPISIPHPSHPHLTTSASASASTSTATTPNWNDVPLAWQTASTPRATSAASSTAFDINALYATANPRTAPRRRQSSMAKERELKAALAAGLVMPGSQTPQWQSYRDEKDEWSRDRKIESARNSISVEADGYGAYGLPRRRGRGRKVAKGFVVVLLLVTVGLMGVWIRGGPLTGLSKSSLDSAGASGSGELMASSSFLEAWGLNISGKWAASANSAGASISEFGERCMAWGSGWRSIVPSFMTKHLFSGTGQAETTQTIRIEKGDAWSRPGTLSRITRGHFIATMSDGRGAAGSAAGTDTASQAEETILSNPVYMTPEEAQARLGEILSGQVSSGDQIADRGSDATPTVLLGGGRMLLDEEPEARNARAARTSEMWIKHAPVAPVHDVGHEGRFQGMLDRREL